MTEFQPVFEAVRAIVERVAGAARTPLGAGPQTRLQEGFWLDSIEMLEVVLECEQQFGIVFEETRDLTPEALASLGSLARLVTARLSESPSST